MYLLVALLCKKVLQNTYIAPYFNRIENIDSKTSIAEMANEIKRTNSSTKILAASFKNVGKAQRK